MPGINKLNFLQNMYKSFLLFADYIMVPPPSITKKRSAQKKKSINFSPKSNRQFSKDLAHFKWWSWKQEVQNICKKCEMSMLVMTYDTLAKKDCIGGGN